MPFSLKTKMVAAGQGKGKEKAQQKAQVRVERNEAEILECKYTMGEMKDKLSAVSGNYRFMLVVDFNKKNQADEAVKGIADSWPVWNPEKKLNTVKIQPTVKHAETCFLAVKPFMTDQTVGLTIPQSLKEASPPTMDWVIFKDACVTGTNQGKPVSYKSGILCAGPTYHVKERFNDNELLGIWTFVVGVNNSGCSGWIYDMGAGQEYPLAVETAIRDWCEPRGVIWTKHLDGFEEASTEAEQPLDATEPRLLPELSPQDNIEAVENSKPGSAGTSGVKTPATASKKRARA